MFSFRSLLFASLALAFPSVNAGIVSVSNLGGPQKTYVLNANFDNATPMSIVYNPANTKYYFGSGGWQSAPIYEADVSGNVLRQTASLDDRGVELWDGRVYVTNYASQQVYVLDTSGPNLVLVPEVLLQGATKGSQSFANKDGIEFVSSQNDGVVTRWSAATGQFVGTTPLQGYNADYDDSDQWLGNVVATCGGIWLTYAYNSGTVFAWDKNGVRQQGWKIPDFYTKTSQQSGNQNPYSISFTDNKFWINNGWNGNTFWAWDLGLPEKCNYGGGGGAVGDPQFTGFSGQSYQVHGTSDTIYNVISSPSFTYNALFSYLEHGKCRTGTACFSHPGNYFGAVGVVIRDSNNEYQQLFVESGDVATGMTVTLNNATLPVSDSTVTIGDYTVRIPSAFELVLESDEFALRVQNSDHFLNQDVAIGSGLARKIAEYRRAFKSGAPEAAKLAANLPHGILGQTWSTKTYSNRWKHIEGQLYDYIVYDGIMGHEFKYSRFQ